VGFDIAIVDKLPCPAIEFPSLGIPLITYCCVDPIISDVPRITGQRLILCKRQIQTTYQTNKKTDTILSYIKGRIVFFMEQSENRMLWEDRIEKQLVSGLTQRQWCNENNLALSAFRYWKLRINKENRKSSDLELKQPIVETVDFAGIVIAPEGTSQNALTEVPTIIEIRISDVTVMLPMKCSET
jgi:hypothetical protein